MPNLDAPETKQRALEILRHHAVDPLSWQTLESDFRHWFGDNGFVGYVDTGRAWVAAGPPVGPADRVLSLAKGFVEAGRRQGRQVVFFGADPELFRQLGAQTLRIGMRPFWDPRQWTLEGHAWASLRYQINRARHKGVSVRRVNPEELNSGTELRAKLDDLATRWQDRQAMPPMGFIVSLEPYVFPQEHLYFVAEQGGEVVAFLSAIPVVGRQGWFVEDILRSHAAPNGTVETLVDAFFREIKGRGATYVTLGLEPLAGDLVAPLRYIRRLSYPLFDFVGLSHFKEKLRPHGHEPRFIGGADHLGRWPALIHVLRAFSRTSFFNFFLATLRRGSLGVVLLLTVLLIVWIPFLIVAQTSVWFPSATAHAAWVVFDLWLAAGLTLLCRNYRHGLAVTLATAVTLDTLLTLYFAITFNAAHMQGILQGSIVAIACLGPLFGAAALWSVVRRQARFRRRGR